MIGRRRQVQDGVRQVDRKSAALKDAGAKALEGGGKQRTRRWQRPREEGARVQGGAVLSSFATAERNEQTEVRIVARAIQDRGNCSPHCVIENFLTSGRNNNRERTQEEEETFFSQRR